jgi:hypothetical protein
LPRYPELIRILALVPRILAVTTNALVGLVGFAMLEVVVFVLASLFLRPSAEIVVEASGHLNQLGPVL